MGIRQVKTGGCVGCKIPSELHESGQALDLLVITGDG
jgi:hypothetical protein